jgi:hypothetical protein
MVSVEELIIYNQLTYIVMSFSQPETSNWLFESVLEATWLRKLSTFTIRARIVFSVP